MIPIQQNVINSTGTLSGEKVAFGIDKNSLVHLTTILSDLYSDAHLAVIRELSVNGKDSQIEKGFTGPLEITLPNSWNPTFTVKDHGVGMSLDDLRQIYTQYGASTKRNSNEFTGSLGLGSKSPLAIADSFSVTSIKDGLKIVCQISKSADGVGELNIIDTVPTDEGSGVTIVIPISFRHSEFNAKAADVFRFWAKGSVLVDEKEPEPIEGIEVAPGIMVCDSLKKDYVICGGIAYPVEMVEKDRYGSSATYGFVKVQSYYRNYGVIVNTKIGEVAFTPSREQLNYSPITRAFVESQRVIVDAAIKSFVDKDISTATTRSEAISKSVNWTKRGFTAAKTFNGIDIPEKFVFDHWHWQTNKSHYSTDRRTTIKFEEFIKETYGSSLRKTLIVTGYEMGRPQTTNKKKIEMWAEANGTAYTHVVFCKAHAVDGWLDSMDTVDFSVIRALRLPKTVSTGTPNRVGALGKYETIDSQGSKVGASSLIGTKVYFFSPSEYEDRVWAKLKVSLPLDSELVIIGLNRHDKLKRDYPAAIHIRDYLRDEAKKVVKALTETDLIQIKLAGSKSQYLDSSKIDDPELVKEINALKAPVSDRVNRYHAFRQLTSLTNLGTERSKVYNYPLYSDSYSTKNMDHVIIYINTIYKLASAKTV